MEEVLVKSVKKALDALNYIANAKNDGGGATLSEISEFLEEKLSTVRNILKTMETCGYVARQGKLYVTGARIYDLFRSEKRRELMEAAAPFMNEAARKTGEPFILTTVSNGKREVLFRVEGTSEIGINLGVTESKNVYSLVTARIILAFSSESEKERFYAENGVPGNEWSEAMGNKLEACLKELKKVGYAVERNKSFHAYAVPIVSANGTTLGSIGTYTPLFRVNKKTEKELLSTLFDIAAKIKTQI
jgi:DNA-binding IclR family transcriptional regulator